MAKSRLHIANRKSKSLSTDDSTCNYQEDLHLNIMYNRIGKSQILVKNSGSSGITENKIRLVMRKRKIVNYMQETFQFLKINKKEKLLCQGTKGDKTGKTSLLALQDSLLDETNTTRMCSLELKVYCYAQFTCQNIA